MINKILRSFPLNCLLYQNIKFHGFFCFSIKLVMILCPLFILSKYEERAIFLKCTPKRHKSSKKSKKPNNKIHFSKILNLQKQVPTFFHRLTIMLFHLTLIFLV
jgi:hypothetical protein